MKLDLLFQTASNMGCIPFRVSFAKVFGNANQALLFQQLLFYWSRGGECKPFYKFKKPCKHKLYKAGDSWTEELFLGGDAIRRALDSIVPRVNKISEIKPTLNDPNFSGAGVRYTDMGNVTWYYMHEKNCAKFLKEANKHERELMAKRMREEEIIDPLTESENPSLESEVSPAPNNIEYKEEKENNNSENIFEKNKISTKEPRKLGGTPNLSEIGKVYMRGKKYGDYLLVDAKLSKETIDDLVAIGYNRTDINSEWSKFRFYYTKGKGKDIKQTSWEEFFGYFWMDTAYKRGFVRKDGENYRENSTSNSRLEQHRKNSSDDMFAEFEGQVRDLSRTS